MQDAFLFEPETFDKLHLASHKPSYEPLLLIIDLWLDPNSWVRLASIAILDSNFARFWEVGAQFLPLQLSLLILWWSIHSLDGTTILIETHLIHKQHLHWSVLSNFSRNFGPDYGKSNSNGNTISKRYSYVRNSENDNILSLENLLTDQDTAASHVCFIRMTLETRTRIECLDSIDIYRFIHLKLSVECWNLGYLCSV